jgi:hypothetical protein
MPPREFGFIGGMPHKEQFFAVRHHALASIMAPASEGTSGLPKPAAGQGDAPETEVARNLKFTGLAQNSQVGPALCLKIPIRRLNLAHILVQPCGFYLRAVAPFMGRPSIRSLDRSLCAHCELHVHHIADNA